MIDHKTTSGFTLVELVLVLILSAILAAVAGPRFFNKGDIDERGFYDQVTAAARFAQKYAVTSGLPVRFAVVTNTSFALTQSNGTAPVRNPGTFANFIGNAPDGITLNMNPTTIVFDAYGTVPTISNSSATVTVGSRSFAIWGATGFVAAP
ncbi:MAG: prepilin-type N-terminal cleavage/methylation domain-containing protein [Gammaproteobacteria bacterium]|nr:prepilin-type N-terminal cleavage/methylation domain-containing protein [Gammaproteobacteria bacterium]